jgi:hypothetical protein
MNHSVNLCPTTHRRQALFSKLFFAGLTIAACNHSRPTFAALSSAYSFTTVASDQGEFGPLYSQQLTMLEDGSALFYGTLKNNTQVIAIGDGGPLSIVTSWTPPPRVGVRAAIDNPQQANAAGEVVLFGNPEGLGSEIDAYHWTEATGLRSIYSSRGGAATAYRFDSDPSINDSGQIAFVAGRTGISPSIFIGDRNGSPATPIASPTPGELGLGDEFDLPQILDTGEVISFAERNNGVQGIFKFSSPGVFVSIFEETSTLRFLSEFDTNRHGKATFVTQSTSGPVSRTVYVGDENGVQPFFAESSQFSPIYSAINDHGKVLVQANDKTLLGDQATLIVGNNPNNGHLIGPGDFLFGNRVLAVFASAGAINNAGQIAFWAQTQNPRTGLQTSGIYIATPIPEPTAAALILIASIFACLRCTLVGRQGAV